MLQGLAADSRPDGFQQLHIRCAAAQHFSQLYAFLAGQTGPQETGGRQPHPVAAGAERLFAVHRADKAHTARPAGVCVIYRRPVPKSGALRRGQAVQPGIILPQLLQAASAAQSAFEEIKTAIAQKGEGSASKGRIVLATVKGDVHDIGKNIVRVILENYGFEVLDLGRDVPVETVVDTVREKDVHLVGLSALMTTTLKSMEETIAALRAAQLDCKIMVGGAVLTPEYAEKIGADWYAKDAKRSADIAKEFFGV